MKKTLVPLLIIVGLIVVGVFTFLVVRTFISEKETVLIPNNDTVMNPSQDEKSLDIPQAHDMPSTPVIETISVSHTQINVKWQYSGPPATFSVFKKEQSEDFYRIDPNLLENDKYIDTDVLCGKEYTYYVVASNSEGSKTSEQSTVQVLSCPSTTHLTQELREEYEQKPLTSPQRTLVINKEGDLLRIFSMIVTQEGFSPSEIIIPYGDNIQINISSPMQQSFTISSSGLELDASIQNGEGSLLMSNPQQGIYTFTCDASCPSPQGTFSIVVR